MVYEYNDGDDLVIVIKNVKNIPDADKFVGRLVTEVLQEEVVQKPTAPAEPATAKQEDKSKHIVIGSDKAFEAASKRFEQGQYGGNTRTEVRDALNDYLRRRFKGLNDQKKKETFLLSLTEESSKEMIKNFYWVISHEKFKKAFLSNRGKEVKVSSPQEIIDFLVCMLAS